MIDFGYGVKLAPLSPDRLWDYYEARNDPNIWKWCRQNDLLQFNQHATWFEVAISGTNPKIKMYEITDGVTWFGVCGLTDIDLYNRRAEFSLYIRPSRQGKGYAKGGLKSLLAHGFLNLGLNIIWGETFDGNPAAGVFKKLGMTHEGTRNDFYFRNGKFIDCDLFSMSRAKFDDLSKDWQGLKVVK